MSVPAILTVAIVSLVFVLLTGMVIVYMVSNWQKQAEEKKRQLILIQNSEQRYSDLFNNVSDIVFVHTLDGIIIEINETVTKELGFSVAEVIGKSMLEFVPPEHNPLLGTYLEGVQRIGEFGGLMQIRTKKGQLKIFDYRNNLVLENGKPVAVRGIARNVTEKQKTREALMESEERYRLFFEQDLAGDFIANPDGEILSCNPAFAQIFGFDTVEDALEFSLIKLFQSETAYHEFLELINQKTRLEHHEDQLLDQNGNTVFVLENIIGIFDDDGNLVRIRGYIFDNTERKQLETQLLHYHKMQGIGTLAGGVAHDFNNILGIIKGHAALLTTDNLNEIDARKSLRSIQHSVDRGAHLVNQILTFARKAQLDFRAVDVNSVIRENVEMLVGTFPRTIAFELTLDEKIPPVWADQGQLHQALLNLCINARDAMPTGGTINLSTSIISPTDIRQKFSNAADNAYVCICISDTGSGMDSETKERLFEPFYTTKSCDQGTGLGLSVVYGIVTGHFGFIQVESAPGEGTTFYLYFPKTTEAVVNEQPPEETEQALDGRETILIVEDEAMLVELLELTFTSNGYSILVARDGVEAVQVYEKNKDKIDLIFSDSRLPRLDGWKAFEQIRKINPQAKAIFSSGFLDPELKSQLARQGINTFVHKPYSPLDVLKTVRETLNQI